MCEEEMITLFNGTFNSTQVLHKAGGIGVEQETAPFLHIQYDFIYKLITLKHWLRTKVNQNKEKLGKNGRVCFGTPAEPGEVESTLLQATPGRKTQAPDAGFEVVTLPSLIGQIWLWRSEATFSPRTPHPAHNPPQEYFVFLKANSQTENESNTNTNNISLASVRI